MFHDISVSTAWFLMTIVIVLVSTPGFTMLYYLHSLFPFFPELYSPLSVIFFVCQAIFALGISLFAILVYSDVMYPLVIFSFAQIISRQALAKESPPNMQYYLPHEEFLDGTLNGTCNDSQIEDKKRD